MHVLSIDDLYLRLTDRAPRKDRLGVIIMNQQRNFIESTKAGLFVRLK